MLPARALRAVELTFTSYPFTLGVASGYPETDGVVLWTRLAPEPLAPGGGMPADATVVPVDWEIAADDGFRRIVRQGSVYASVDWGHSVHVEAQGLEPGSDYWYRFMSGGAQSPIGHTRTAPTHGNGQRTVAVASCQHYEAGYYAAYAAMAREDLDLVLHVGDYIYENRGIERVRGHDQPECFTLEDYRLRHALYRLDPMLQAAHANAPWMLAMDDHEVDNDYAAALSEDNDPEAFFLARRAAAYQAYYEHQPLPRRQIPLGANQRLHTRRALGDLVDVYMLDGRQYRSVHACGKGLVSPCAELYDEQRTMLGEQQERWLHSTLGRRQARWTLFAQQTVFAHADQQPGADVGYWSDGWSGYPAARQRLLDSIAANRVRNPIILSGDIHAFLVNDVHARPGDSESPVLATEFVTTSISSRGPSQQRMDSWINDNPNIHIARSDTRGYTKLTLTPENLRAELIAVDDVSRSDSEVSVLSTYEVRDGSPGIVV